MNVKYRKYTNFKKYEYSEISNPYVSFSTKLSNFRKIFFSNQYRSSYYRDVKLLSQKSLAEVKDAKRFHDVLKVHRLTDLIIGSYVFYSFFWHFKKGYFNSSKGSRLLDLYICGKIVFNIGILSMISYFAFKWYCDPMMYSYYVEKEREWEDKADELNKEKLAVNIDRKVKIIRS